MNPLKCTFRVTFCKSLASLYDIEELKLSKPRSIQFRRIPKPHDIHEFKNLQWILEYLTRHEHRKINDLTLSPIWKLNLQKFQLNFRLTPNIYVSIGATHQREREILQWPSIPQLQHIKISKNFLKWKTKEEYWKKCEI